MSNRKHGITANTYKRFILDAGMVVTGFTDFTTGGYTVLGATKGGSSLTIEQEIKEMEVDGAPGPVIGSRRITRVVAKLTVNFIEHTLDNLKRIIAGSESATFDTNYDKITRALVLEDGDYLTDITILGEVSGVANACGIQLSNALSDGNFEISFEDKEEGVIAATFTAHFDPDDLDYPDDTEPWAIIWPNEA